MSPRASYVKSEGARSKEDLVQGLMAFKSYNEDRRRGRRFSLLDRDLILMYIVLSLEEAGKVLKKYRIKHFNSLDLSVIAINASTAPSFKFKDND